MTSFLRDVYASREEAEVKLPEYRRALLAKLREAAAAGEVRLDSTPESLEAVERWSFEVRRSEGFERIGMTPGQLTEALYFYMGAVCVRHAGAKWEVQQDLIDPRRFAAVLRHKRTTFSIFDRRPENGTGFWDTERRGHKPGELRGWFDRIVQHAAPEDHPLVRPFARRLARDARRTYQMALLRAGYSPWTEDDLLRAYREFPSGAVRAFALECLGNRKVAGERGEKLLEEIAAGGKFWEHRVAAAKALAELFGRRRGALFCALFIEAPSPHRAPLAALLHRFGTAEVIDAVCAHVLELTRRKRKDSDNPRELAHCLAYLERVGKHHIAVESVLHDIEHRWKRLTPADVKAVREVVKRFAAEAMAP